MYFYAWYTSAMMSLPFKMFTSWLKFTMKTFTINFSSVNIMSQEPLDWDGMIMHKHVVVLPDFLGANNSLITTPLGHYLQFSLTTDKSKIKDPKKLMDLINKNFREFIDTPSKQSKL